MRRAWIWIVLAVLVVAAIAGALAWQARPIAVAMAQARKGQAAELVYATGFVESQQPVSVQSRITAPVAKVLVEEGQRVVKGQPLFLLEDNEQRAAVAQAAAQRRAAEQTEARTLTLFRQGWVTKAARDQAVANADVARAAVTSAGARQDQLVVRAEIDGIVTKRDVEPGELATPTRVLAQLGDPARVRVTATVDERDIARVMLGQQALMSSDAWPGRIIPATVAEVTPSGDPAQRAFRVRLMPAPGANLPLGITLEVNIVIRRKDDALLIPASAVADGKVWVVEDGRAVHRAVRTGITGADSVEIVGGLTQGATVVTSPPASLSDGQRVKAAR